MARERKPGVAKPASDDHSILGLGSVIESTQSVLIDSKGVGYVPEDNWDSVLVYIHFFFLWPCKTETGWF